MNIITSSEYKIDSSTEKIVADFLSLKADGKRFAFGRNEHSESLIKNHYCPKVFEIKEFSTP